MTDIFSRYCFVKKYQSKERFRIKIDTSIETTQEPLHLDKQTKFATV
jgi:hypothetical protein